jgi:subtilase family serine protease
MHIKGLGSRALSLVALAAGVALALVVMGSAPCVAEDQARLPIANNHPAYVPDDWRPLPAGQVLHVRAILALRNTDQLVKLEADLQDRDSPRYHRWLTTDQFVTRFGPTTQQMQAVASWLTSQGLRVTASDIRKRSVEFSGDAATMAQVLQIAFVGDDHNYANLGDPLVPADLAPTIQVFLGLSRFETSAPAGGTDPSPNVTIPGVGTAFGPPDLYTFYDENPLISGGNRGTGKPDCIAMAETNDVSDLALAAFDDQFGLPPIALTRVFVDGSHPAVGSGEPFLDAEWAHAIAPNTPIIFYLGQFFDDVARAVADNRCGVITASVSEQCPDVPSILAYNATLAQAVVQGQTVLHAAGDFGANWPCGKAVPTEPRVDQSSCGLPKGATFSQPSVDEESSSPYLTSVGGTMFDPVYDSAGNDTSVIGDNLETVWNEGSRGPDHCPVKDAGSGGKSSLFPKPAWQKGYGVPNDKVRDVPDIALGASGHAPGFFIAVCEALPCTRPAKIKACPDKGKVCFRTSGGTSIASPMWAALTRLIAQSQGVTRLGNINRRLYELGNLRKPAFGLHDITIGNNDDNGIRGYDAGPGFDLATGWGTPDFAALVAAFPGAAAAASPSTATIAAGATADAGQFTVTNTTSTPLMLDSVTVALTAPNIFSKLALTAAAGGVSTSAVEAVPAAETVFKFAVPPAIPAGATATLTLQATAAATIPSGAALTQLPGDPRGGWTRSMLPLCAALIAAFMLVAVALAGRPAALAPAAIFFIAAAALWAAGCGSGNGNPFHPALSSTQTLAQGSIALSDGQGGKTELSGLPASLGTVKVIF